MDDCTCRSCNPAMFNEISLLRAIEDQWGEHGAHADVFASMLKEMDRLRKENDAYRESHVALGKILNMG